MPRNSWLRASSPTRFLSIVTSIHAVPNNPGLLLNLGMALHLAGEESKAITPLESAVKLDPNLAPAWLFLGAARLQSVRLRWR